MMLYISSACLIIAKSLLLESCSKKEFWLLNCFQLSLLLTSQGRPLICECNFASDEIAWHVSSYGCPRKIVKSPKQKKPEASFFLTSTKNFWSFSTSFLSRLTISGLYASSSAHVVQTVTKILVLFFVFEFPALSFYKLRFFRVTRGKSIRHCFKIGNKNFSVTMQTI